MPGALIGFVRGWSVEYEYAFPQEVGELGGEDETREGQIWKDFICQIEEFRLSPSGLG